MDKRPRRSTTNKKSLGTLLDSHAPAKTRTIKNRNDCPWFNPDISAAKRKRRKLERKWRSNVKLYIDRELWCAQKNLEFNDGLLWQEERELTRALYASLQRPRSEQDIADDELQENLKLQSKESKNQGSELPLDLPQADVQLGAEPHFVEFPATCTDSSAEPLLLSEPQRLSDITEQQSILEVVGHSVVDNPVEDHHVVVHPIVDESVEEHSVLAQAVVNHTAVNHALVDIVHPEEPLNITDPDHNDIQATEAFHDLNSAKIHPQPEECPVKTRSRDPAKPKSSERKDNSVYKGSSSKSKKLSEVERSPKVQKSSKLRDFSRSKKSLERKRSHKKKVISGKFKFSMISSSKLVSTRTLKPELSKPVVTRSRSPKFMSPGLLGIKSKEVSKKLSESIAHRLKASVSGSSGSAMGNILCRPLRSQKKKQNAEANAVTNDCADEKKNSGDFLPPPPPLPPPLLLTKKHKSNAVAHSKQSLTKCKEKKCFAVCRESSVKASQVPSIHDKNPKLKSIPKQPLRSLRRDLRSRSKFKMPQAEPAASPAIRRSTRGQNTASSSPSSGASSYTDSQDETKSTTSSTSLVTRQSIARKAKERLMVKRKSSAAIVSSTSGEEDDVKSSKPKKAKVQAQRKFAYPQAFSPGYTPSKVKNGDINSTKSCSIFNHCPSTEDFLTFLCLRASEVGVLDKWHNRCSILYSLQSSRSP
ncbi:uncharacterized protein LOC135153230 [Lytechinus pictus]|uniref:uncharacterized protein LOC135153230 n=1 Tax=Lytechinus pictus TaxID=7653 RepID=UPI0030B9E257